MSSRLGEIPGDHSLNGEAQPIRGFGDVLFRRPSLDQRRGHPTHTFVLPPREATCLQRVSQSVTSKERHQREVERSRPSPELGSPLATPGAVVSESRATASGASTPITTRVGSESERCCSKYSANDAHSTSNCDTSCFLNLRCKRRASRPGLAAMARQPAVYAQRVSAGYESLATLRNKRTFISDTQRPPPLRPQWPTPHSRDWSRSNLGLWIRKVVWS
jgi:hypothetical protein